MFDTAPLNISHTTQMAFNKPYKSDHMGGNSMGGWKIPPISLKLQFLPWQRCGKTETIRVVFNNLFS
jgi:hypothetical protein